MSPLANLAFFENIPDKETALPISISTSEHLETIFTVEFILKRLRSTNIIDVTLNDTNFIKELLQNDPVITTQDIDKITSFILKELACLSKVSVNFLFNVFYKACLITNNCNHIYRKHSIRFVISNILESFFAQKIDPLIADNACQLRAISFFILKDFSNNYNNETYIDYLLACYYTAGARLKYKPRNDPLQIRLILIEKNPLKFFRENLLIDLKTIQEQHSKKIQDTGLKLRKFVASACINIIRYYCSISKLETYTNNWTEIVHCFDRKNTRNIKILNFDEDTIEVVNLYAGFLFFIELVKILKIPVKLTVNRLSLSGNLLEKKQSVEIIYLYNEHSKKFTVVNDFNGPCIEVLTCSMYCPKYTPSKQHSQIPFFLESEENFRKAVIDQIDFESMILQTVAIHPVYPNNIKVEDEANDCFFTEDRQKKILLASESGYGTNVLRGASISSIEQKLESGLLEDVYLDPAKNTYYMIYNSEKAKVLFPNVIPLTTLHIYAGTIKDTYRI